MTWGEVFVVFFVTHQVGDYLLQTDWQATHKAGGLSRDRVARRALLSHTFTYSLAYVPAFVWISSLLGWQTLFVAAAVSIPHLVQDDGRLLTLYIRKVKRMEPVRTPPGRSAGRPGSPHGGAVRSGVACERAEVAVAGRATKPHSVRSGGLAQLTQAVRHHAHDQLSKAWSLLHEHPEVARRNLDDLGLSLRRHRHRPFGEIDQRQLAKEPGCAEDCGKPRRHA